jgi:hypothetical protein
MVDIIIIGMDEAGVILMDHILIIDVRDVQNVEGIIMEEPVVIAPVK